MAITIEPNGCWRPSNLPKSNGYVRLNLRGESFSGHRLMYELFVGPVPPDKVLDHLCRNRWCCNPQHLEVVTQQENVLRGDGPGRFARRTECHRGHPFDEQNTYYRKGGGRACKACQAEATRRYREKAS